MVVRSSTSERIWCCRKQNESFTAGVKGQSESPVNRRVRTYPYSSLDGDYGIATRHARRTP